MDVPDKASTDGCKEQLRYCRRSRLRRESQWLGRVVRIGEMGIPTTRRPEEEDEGERPGGTSRKLEATFKEVRENIEGAKDRGGDSLRVICILELHKIRSRVAYCRMTQ